MHIKNRLPNYSSIIESPTTWHLCMLLTRNVGIDNIEDEMCGIKIYVVLKPQYIIHTLFIQVNKADIYCLPLFKSEFCLICILHKMLHQTLQPKIFCNCKSEKMNILNPPVSGYYGFIFLNVSHMLPLL